MSRSINLIRADIERLVAERADLFRRQQGDTFQPSDLADVRIGLDARLHMLWGELRQARADILRVSSMSDGEARLVVARVPQLAFA